jgi:hypothetical protein
MWRAARKIWGFLLLFVVVQWIIGIFFFLLLHRAVNYTTVPLWVFGLIIGILTAFAPIALENTLLPSEGATVANLQARLTQLLLKLNLVLRYNYANAIESCREQDLYDLQHTDKWLRGLTPKTIKRRLRILYEGCKEDISEHRQDPTLLQYDVDYAPEGKFYLLVRHLGRRKLRHYLRTDLISPGPGWDGSERRRVKGSKEQRLVKNGSDRQRIYDDVPLMRRSQRARLSRTVLMAPADRPQENQQSPALAMPADPPHENQQPPSEPDNELPKT